MLAGSVHWAGINVQLAAGCQGCTGRCSWVDVLNMRMQVWQLLQLRDNQLSWTTAGTPRHTTACHSTALQAAAGQRHKDTTMGASTDKAATSTLAAQLLVRPADLKACTQHSGYQLTT
jgi:hypothetical protein